MPSTVTHFPPERQFHLNAGTRADEALALWQSKISDTFTDLCPAINPGDLFHAEMQTSAFEGVHVSHIRALPHVVSRSRSHIRHSHNDNYFLVRQLVGESEVDFDDGTVRMAVGDFALVDPDIPYRLMFKQPFEQQCVQIPQLWLRERLDCTDRQLGNRLLNADAPMVRLLGLSLDQLTTSTGEDEATTRNLSELFFDILLRAMRGTMPMASDAANGCLTPERIRNYIAHRYTDPDLAPAEAAAVLGCSVRNIHRVCGLAGTSFGRLLLEARLVASRRILEQAPATNGAISRAAMDAGFSDHAHFSRAFKERFGSTPRQFSRMRCN